MAESALCALQRLPKSGSVQVSDVAAAKIQVSPEASVRALEIHVGESAMCDLQRLPASGSVQVAGVKLAKISVLFNTFSKVLEIPLIELHSETGSNVSACMRTYSPDVFTKRL